MNDGELEQRLEEAILDLLGRRSKGKTICPSEAARLVAPDDWRSLLGPTRAAVRRLVVRGEVVVTQRGKVVDLDATPGAIRVRRPPRQES